MTAAVLPFPRRRDEVTIPADIETAVRDLTGLGELVTASEWKRAAIVWAFTTDEANGRGNRGTSTALSARAFAELGITGLKSDKTVRQYRSAWKLAIQHGMASDVKPGDFVNLPDLEWQEYFNPRDNNNAPDKPPARDWPDTPPAPIPWPTPDKDYREPRTPPRQPDREPLPPAPPPSPTAMINELHRQACTALQKFLGLRRLTDDERALAIWCIKDVMAKAQSVKEHHEGA